MRAFLFNYTFIFTKGVEIHYQNVKRCRNTLFSQYNVGMGLKSIRISKGLTQAEAASIAGVSLESYKNHELGRSKIDSPLGRIIFKSISSYEKYSFDQGVLTIDEIKTAVSFVLEEKDVSFAYLFGSYAKGEANERSDVDLLISGSITGLDFFSLGGELERALHKRVDVIRLEDIASNAELIQEILKSGVKIYEKR